VSQSIRWSLPAARRMLSAGPAGWRYGAWPACQSGQAGPAGSSPGRRPHAPPRYGNRVTACSTPSGASACPSAAATGQGSDGHEPAAACGVGQFPMVIAEAHRQVPQPGRSKAPVFCQGAGQPAVINSVRRHPHPPQTTRRGDCASGVPEMGVDRRICGSYGIAAPGGQPMWPRGRIKLRSEAACRRGTDVLGTTIAWPQGICERSGDGRARCNS
jgi:hypothetical protein